MRILAQISSITPMPDCLEMARELCVVVPMCRVEWPSPSPSASVGPSSSYPPHKHDRDTALEEILLEETYYPRLNPPQVFAFQRVYTDERSLDEACAVENHAVVMVPRGYHPVWLRMVMTCIT